MTHVVVKLMTFSIFDITSVVNKPKRYSVKKKTSTCTDSPPKYCLLPELPLKCTFADSVNK